MARLIKAILADETVRMMNLFSGSEYMRLLKKIEQNDEIVEEHTGFNARDQTIRLGMLTPCVQNFADFTRTLEIFQFTLNNVDQYFMMNF